MDWGNGGPSGLQGALTHSSGLTSQVLSATCSTDGMGTGTGRGEDMGAGAAAEYGRQCLDRSSVLWCSEKFSTLG